jgi:2-keto-4-pentenoate hydratase
MRTYLLATLPALLLLCLAPGSPAVAACLTDAEVQSLFAAYTARVPATNPAGLTAAQGECSRDKFNRMLRTALGEPVGYKAGLTNPAVQQRFKHNAPVRGILYGPMLLDNGATVAAGFGARPLFEADLLVRVSDSAINRATTPAEVLGGIDQVIPFIELPDLTVVEPAALDGAGIIAINVGARLGVLGTPIAVTPDSSLIDALQNMQVVVRGNGAELDHGRGSDVLEHPLNAVVWLVSDLARAGLGLRPGDLVSLGSFSRLLPPEPGLAVEAQYVGLPGDPVVRVIFR